MTRRRALDWVLIAVLTGSWAVLFARGVDDGLRNQRGSIRLGISSAAAPDAYPTVIWSHWKPTIAAGDEVTAVEGQSVRGSSALRVYDLATRAARERGDANISALRSGSAFDVRLGLVPLPWWWGGSLFSAGLLASSLILLLRAPQWHLARRGFVGSWFLAVGMVTFAAQGGPAATALEPTFAYLAWAIGSVLVVWNAQDFTLSAQPVPVLHRALAVLPGVLNVATYAVRYLLPHSVAVGDVAVLAPGCALAVGAIAGLTRSYVRSESLERRQLRWVVLGFYVALVGNVIALAVSTGPVMRLLHVDGNAVGQVVRSATGLGFPAGIVISVLAYRWLDIDRLISAAASYTIVGFAGLGTGLALIPRFSGATAPALGLDAAVLQWLLAMVLALAAVTAHGYLRPRLERTMFAERYQRMAGFALLLEEIGPSSGGEELWGLISKRIETLLDPESLVVYARDGDTFSARFSRGGAAWPPYAADSVLVRALERRGRPLAADAADLDPFGRAALETLGVELLVPICAHGVVLAFACLGAKRSGDIYTREEVTQLAAVATRSAQVLRPEPPPLTQTAQAFRREGDLWTISSHGKEIRLHDMRGLQYLAVLLREPGREFAVTDLVGVASGLAGPQPDPELQTRRRLGDAGPVLDGQARAAYRERVTALERELADAERCADLGRLERASAERELLVAELESAGRGRRAGSDSERARVAVTKAIKAALEKIAERHPELGAHLVATVRRGYTCAYEPDPRVPIAWEV